MTISAHDTPRRGGVFSRLFQGGGVGNPIVVVRLVGAATERWRGAGALRRRIVDDGPRRWRCCFRDLRSCRCPPRSDQSFRCPAVRRQFVRDSGKSEQNSMLRGGPRGRHNGCSGHLSMSAFPFQHDAVEFRVCKTAPLAHACQHRFRQNRPPCVTHETVIARLSAALSSAWDKHVGDNNVYCLPKKLHHSPIYH